jgi:hypothetical protein
VASDSPVRRTLTSSEIGCLNQAGLWLDTLKSPNALAFGDLFVQALSGDNAVTLPKVVIGSPPGLNPAIAEAKDLIGAAQSLEEQAARNELSATANFQKTCDLLSAARLLQASKEQLPKSFFLQLVGGDPAVRVDLVAAFNELLALSTPARWAYRDIELKPAVENGNAALGMETLDGGRVDLLFNTAELNASALTLFLLLAPRLSGPLRVLILDDPFQNMDELTVTTLARAFARLVRLVEVYPARWRIMALFHGAENVERIRQETPCAVYNLPWLRLTGSSAEELIEALQDQSTWQCQQQDLEFGLLAENPRRSNSSPADPAFAASDH